MFIPWNYVQSKRNIKHLLLFSIKIIIINFAVKSISTFAFLYFIVDANNDYLNHSQEHKSKHPRDQNETKFTSIFFYCHPDPHFLRRIVLYFMKISFVGLCWLPSLSSISFRANKNGNSAEAIFLISCFIQYEWENLNVFIF